MDHNRNTTPIPASAVLTFAYTVAAVILGLLAGWVDFNNDEPQAAAILLLFFGLIFGIAQPRHAWRWGLILGLGIPGAYLIARTLGYEPVTPPEPGAYAELLAIIPAMIGTYAGVLIRKVMRMALPS